MMPIMPDARIPRRPSAGGSQAGWQGAHPV